MPIYYGNTKLDITSKGIVKKLTSRPAYNEKFIIGCTTDGTYLKCVLQNNNYTIEPTNDISEASTCFITVDDWTGYDVLNIDTPDNTSYNLAYGSVLSKLTTRDGQSSAYRILLHDYDNMYCSYAYLLGGDSRIHYAPLLSVAANSQYSRYDVTHGEGVLDPDTATYASLPLEFYQTDFISTPSGIGKVYYGSTLVYDKDNN